MYICTYVYTYPYRQQFKARPLNSKILDPSYHGMCGVVKEATRPATKPITPKLATALRESARKNNEKSQLPSNSTAFKAQEIPKHMFECVKVSTYNHFYYSTYVYIRSKLCNHNVILTYVRTQLHA